VVRTITLTSTSAGSASDCGKRVRGVGGGTNGDDGQHEGQVHAPGDDLVGAVGLRVDPVGQQPPSLVRR
jgi:hypothetical protein